MRSWKQKIAAVSVVSFLHYANGKSIFHFHVNVKRHFFSENKHPQSTAKYLKLEESWLYVNNMLDLQF